VLREHIPGGYAAQMSSREGSALGGSRLARRALTALALANARYWATVAPLVRRHVAGWERRADAIPDPVLRIAALEKLREARLNVDMAATLATLAPRRDREATVEAIVALEVLSDYLDGLGEVPLGDPIGDGRHLFGAFGDAIASDREPSGDYYARYPWSGDAGYMDELIAVVRGALARLPAREQVAEVMTRAGARSAEAQLRTHAIPALGPQQAEEWASAESAAVGVGWREFLAGAGSSVIAVHALIAVAADPKTTTEQAELIDAAYLAGSALATMLDCLVDYERDAGEGRLQIGYMQLYEDRGTFAEELAAVARRAIRNAAQAPNGAHHVMTVSGIVAYYSSEPGARTSFAGPVLAQIQQELRPVIIPTLTVMRIWRAARRLGRGREPQAGSATAVELPTAANALDTAVRVPPR
jgi:tetraprenyl-beta-curcumene synthase